MKTQNILPKIAILVMAAIGLLFGNPVMAGQFAIPEGNTYSQNSRKDAVTDIIRTLIAESWKQKPLQYKYDDGSKTPGIRMYEAVIPVKNCQVTVQYFPPQQGVTASSISFFVTEKKKEPKKCQSPLISVTVLSGLEQGFLPKK